MSALININGQIKIAIFTLIILFALTGFAFAADDSSIKAQQREGVRQAMDAHIDESSIDGVYNLYDAVEGKWIELNFEQYHEGIMKKGDTFVGCADFTDAKNREFDIDFHVIEGDDGFETFQAIIHKIDGKKYQAAPEE
jgi:hypothetical protein